MTKVSSKWRKVLQPSHSLGLFGVHILKDPPGLFSNPEVKLERVYGVVTWETSGEMCMTSTSSLWGILFRIPLPFLRDSILYSRGHLFQFGFRRPLPFFRDSFLHSRGGFFFTFDFLHPRGGSFSESFLHSRGQSLSYIPEGFYFLSAPSLWDSTQLFAFFYFNLGYIQLGINSTFLGREFSLG